MRICFFTSYPPDRRGSANYYRNLTEALAEADPLSQIYVLAMKKSWPSFNPRDQILVDRCWEPDFLFIFSVIRKVVKIKPDIIHVHFSFYSAFYVPQLLIFLTVMRLLGKAVVTQVDEIILLKNIGEITRLKHMMKLILILITSMVCKLSSKIIVWKRDAKSFLVNDYKVSKDKLSIIPHGVEIQEIKDDPENAKGILGLQGRKVVMFFGILDKTKGVECAIKSFKLVSAKLPESILLIAGSPNPYRFKDRESRIHYVDSLKTLIRKNGLEKSVILMARYITPDEIPLLFSASDTIILPYISTYKCTCSGVFNVAAGYGKPLIATDIPFFNGEVENGNNAIVVPPADEKSLAESISNLLENEHLKLKIGSNLRQDAEMRTWDKVALKHSKLYRETARYCRT